MRRQPNVDVRSCRYTRYCKVESKERNTVGTEIFHQSLPFVATRINSDVHRIAMVVAPSVVQR